MASKKDSKCSSYLKVSKGQTTLLIPEPLPSDSTDNTVVTLFNEENELGPSTKCDSVSESLITTSPPPTYKKTPKRKLEIEFGSLSQTTPKRKSDSFSQLQSFWENKSGGKSASKLHLNNSDESLYRVSNEVFKSPIDETMKNFDNSGKSIKNPLKSAKQIALDYTQLLQSVVKTSVVKPQNESSGDVDNNVYDFNDDDNPVERMSLTEFRQAECESPMRVVSKAETKSPIMFDPKKFLVKKSKIPLKRSRSACNSMNRTDMNVESPSVNSELDKSEIMPPPSTIPKCLSMKKRSTPSPRSTPKLSIKAPKLRQKLFEDVEYSPDDLMPPSLEVGKKRKRVSKKHLLSMEPSNYSQLYTPPNSKDSSDSEQKFTKSSSVSVTVERDGEISMDFESSVDNASDVWTQSEISLSNISAITPVSDKTNNEINQSNNMKILDTQNKTSETEGADSFDLTLNTDVGDNERSMVDIDNISAIESGTKEMINDNRSLLNCSELCTPEIVKVSGGRKRLILEKEHTTLNDTMISVVDSSVDDYSINPEVANVVGAVVGNYFGVDESCAGDKSVNKVAESLSSEDKVLENCEDSRLNGTYPELCNHIVSVAELRAIVTGNLDENNNSESSIEINESDDISSPETSEVSEDTDPETGDSFSTEYEYNMNLSYPPPLHIDLSQIEDMGPQSRGTAVEVTGNIWYESSEDILDLDKHEPNESEINHVPETLKILCVRRLVDCRSWLYTELLPGKVEYQNSYLSMPLHVDVTNSENQTDHTVTFDLRKKLESVRSKSGITDPCYSPDLASSESPTLSTSCLVPASRNLLCWSPVLDSSDAESYLDTDHTTDTSDCDNMNKYDVTQKRNLKRPRRLEFGSSDDSSDLYTPSPKLPRTPLTDRYFEFPGINERNEGALNNGDGLLDSEKSVCDSDCQSEMKTLSEIDEKDLLERSYLSDSEYPESLNSSTAYSELYKLWSPFSSVSTSCQRSPTSSLSEHESGKISLGLGEQETYPVYTQSGPTHLPSHLPSSRDVSSEPLDLSMTGENKDCENVSELLTSSVENEIELSNEMLDFYEPICISEPRVATLEQNNSSVWKEIDIGSVSYSYEPSAESTQYATDCFNNAVYGVSSSGKWSAYEPRYIATALYPNPAERVPNESAFPNVDQNDTVESNCNVPVIEGLTIPIQNCHIPSAVSAAVPTVYGVTVPLQNSCTSLNCEQIPQDQSFPNSQNIPSTLNKHEQSVNQVQKLNACYYGDKLSSVNEQSLDGYESTGNSAGSSGSDSENDLMKMMDNSVRNKLKKKAGSRFISPTDDSFELSDSLKGVRPYVISGWISTTYLMALARKTDLVNDMFDNALNEKGEIHDWIVESCRTNTPAVLARDLVFRLFTLEELENLSLISLARKKRFKAMKKCVEKKFPQKLTRRVWNVSCLGLIKSSVSTLFKHRVRHVQNFLVMHGACA